jgi:DNA-binding MarR family transcriptional regulator
MPADLIAEERLATDLLERIATLRRALRRATSQPWPGGSLTGAQLELLRTVRREPGISVNEAADALRVAPNTVSSLVGQLVDAGLMLRAQDARDRRVARLELSPSARRQLEAWRDERALALREALERLDADDLRVLAAASGPLSRVVEALDG